MDESISNKIKAIDYHPSTKSHGSIITKLKNAKYGSKRLDHHTKRKFAKVRDKARRELLDHEKRQEERNSKVQKFW